MEIIRCMPSETNLNIKQNIICFWAFRLKKKSLTVFIAQLVRAPPGVHLVVSLRLGQVILIPKTWNYAIIYLWYKTLKLLELITSF